MKRALFVLLALTALLLAAPAYADCPCDVTGVCTCGPDCNCQQVVTADTSPVTADLLVSPDYPGIAYSRSKKAWIPYTAPVSAPVQTSVPTFFPVYSPGGCSSGNCGSGVRSFGGRLFGGGCRGGRCGG